jgi:hypothetical protein
MNCPIENCVDRIQQPFGHDSYKNIQHHLWQHHGLDVVEAHRLAATVASPLVQKTYFKKTAKKDRGSRDSQALVEFKRKQLEFDFPGA